MKKQCNIYFINILLVVGIFLIVLLHNNIYPFGVKTISYSDGTSQFVPMIFDYLTKIRLGTIGTYTFNNGLGNPYLFNLLYYISSPINYLVIMFKKPETMYFATIIIKLIITSICITKYTKNKTDNNTVIIISTLSYCFCSWFYTYYYYSSFVDIFMMFPLFQNGLEKVLKKEINYSYIFSLTYMLIANFYLSFSVCIYTIIFFILYNIYHKHNLKEFFQSFKWISINTILSLLLSFFWLYALLDTYQRTGLAFDKNANVFFYYTYFRRFVSFLYYGNYHLVLSNGGERIPNIACPTIILISFFYFFLNRNITNRQKVFALISTFLVLLVIFFKPFDFVLNMFHQIRGLTYRYSFIICFLEILLFIENCNHLDLKDKYTKRGIIIAILLTIVINLYCYLIMSKSSIIIEIIGITSIISLLLLYQNNKVFKALLIITIMMQTIIGASTSFVLRGDNQIIESHYKVPDEKYRIKDLKPYCKKRIKNLITMGNCNLYDNTKSLDLFTSMTYNNVVYDLEKLGVVTSLNTYIRSNRDDILINMLFNVNNKYYLEKIYSVNKNVLNTKIKEKDIVNNQKSLVKNMTGIEEIFKSFKVKAYYRSEKNYYDVNNDYYYIDLYDNKGNKQNSVFRVDRVFQNKNKYNNELTYYIYDYNKIKEVHNYLKKNQIDYSYYTDSKIEGTINVDKDQMIFTSIPYDTNWDIYLDGKKVKPVKILNSLMGIKASPGKHSLKLEYKYHLLIPILVSVITFISLIITIIIKTKKKKYIIMK